MDRLVLGLSVPIWILYGLYCFFVPGALLEIAGVTGTHEIARTEIRAMYGGLQIAIGALALAGLLREELRRPALLGLAFLTGGLAAGRLLGAILEGGFGGYTYGALGFEIATVLLATWALRSRPLATA